MICCDIPFPSSSAVQRHQTHRSRPPDDRLDEENTPCHLLDRPHCILEHDIDRSRLTRTDRQKACSPTSAGSRRDRPERGSPALAGRRRRHGGLVYRYPGGDASGFAGQDLQHQKLHRMGHTVSCRRTSTPPLPRPRASAPATWPSASPASPFPGLLRQQPGSGDDRGAPQGRDTRRPSALFPACIHHVSHDGRCCVFTTSALHCVSAAIRGREA